MASGDYRSCRLVLRHSSAEDEVERFAATLGWPRVGEQQEDPETGASREIMWAAGTAVSLHYVEDPVSLHSYVIARGHDPNVVNSLIQLADGNLDTWSLDELLGAVREADEPAGLARAVIRAGLGSPDDFDVRFFECISQAMSHSDTWVREAALYATTYAAWPQYRHLLEHAAHRDPDAERRDDASIVLESFDIEGVGES